MHPNVSVVYIQETGGAETLILGVGVLNFIEIVAGVVAGGIGIVLVVQFCIVSPFICKSVLRTYRVYLSIRSYIHVEEENAKECKNHSHHPSKHPTLFQVESS